MNLLFNLICQDFESLMVKSIVKHYFYHTTTTRLMMMIDIYDLVKKVFGQSITSDGSCLISSHFHGAQRLPQNLLLLNE